MGGVYDVVFVGAGVANLYAAHQLLQVHPRARIRLLEKACARVGGRVGLTPFAGVPFLFSFSSITYFSILYNPYNLFCFA
jgi:phytoene dehydrogenase-like protein